jgi:diaminopimelate epimerase
MRNLEFHKYHGAGNDFVIIDNRDQSFQVSDAIIKKLCHRRFGIGADGLILLAKSKKAAFKMDFYNNDGSSGIMCGNGARCLALFAIENMTLNTSEVVAFETIDGLHNLNFNADNTITVAMHFDSEIEKVENFYISRSKTAPHAIVFVADVSTYDVLNIGKALREKHDVNVNFITIENDVVYARTFERGVEDETLACGTGAVSIAMTLYRNNILKLNKYKINMPGGTLIVSFENKNGLINGIKLSGEAKKVFKGEFFI